MLINYSFFIALEKVLLWKFKFPVEFPSYIFDCGKACEILILKSNENLKYSKLQNCVSKSFFFLINGLYHYCSSFDMPN